MSDGREQPARREAEAVLLTEQLDESSLGSLEGAARGEGSWRDGDGGVWNPFTVRSCLQVAMS